MQRRQRHRRSRVSPLRLKNQGTRLDPDLAQLLRHHETMLFVADHYRGIGFQ